MAARGTAASDDNVKVCLEQEEFEPMQFMPSVNSPVNPTVEFYYTVVQDGSTRVPNSCSCCDTNCSS